MIPTRRKKNTARVCIYGQVTTVQPFGATAEAMKIDKPYQTRLDPPPGPPADAEGNFLPLPQWLPGQPQPADWPPHTHPPKAGTGEKP